MTDIRKLSLVLHCSSWNVPSSDTNKHKENILEKDIQIYNHRAAEILQFCIITICFVKRQTVKLTKHRHFMTETCHLGYLGCTRYDK